MSWWWCNGFPGGGDVWCNGFPGGGDVWCNGFPGGGDVWCNGFPGGVMISWFTEYTFQFVIKVINGGLCCGAQYNAVLWRSVQRFARCEQFLSFPAGLLQAAINGYSEEMCLHCSTYDYIASSLATNFGS